MSEYANIVNVVDIDKKETLERSEKSKKTNFSIIDNSCLQNTMLSLEAIGFLSHLLSLPDDWVVYSSYFCKKFNVGVKKVRAIMAELIDSGYMQRTRLRGERGRLGGWITKYSDTPEFLIFKCDSPESQNGLVVDSPESHLPPVVKEQLQSTKGISYKVNNKKYKKDFDKEFDEFWEQYPKKVDKHKANMIYEKLLKQEGLGLHEVVMIALCGQVREREITEGLGMWVSPMKHPTTWLNGRCWGNQFKTEDAIREEFERSNKKSGKQPSKSEQSFNALQEYERKLQRQAREEWLREHGGEPEDSKDI